MSRIRQMQSIPILIPRQSHLRKIVHAQNWTFKSIRLKEDFAELISITRIYSLNVSWLKNKRSRLVEYEAIFNNPKHKKKENQL